jgi:hypothetical protein
MPYLWRSEIYPIKKVGRQGTDVHLLLNMRSGV